MPYVSIACIISYVIGHALGPSMYPRAGSVVSLPLSCTTSPRNFWPELLREPPGRGEFGPNGFSACVLVAEGLGQSMTRARTVKQPV